MDANYVRQTLIDVLQTIQAISGLECPKLTGNTKPIEALPEFSSKIWPVATGILAEKLKIDIPEDVNIFREEKACVARTLDQSVAMIMEILGSAGQESGKAAVGQ